MSASASTSASASMPTSATRGHGVKRREAGLALGWGAIGEAQIPHGRCRGQEESKRQDDEFGAVGYQCLRKTPLGLTFAMQTSRRNWPPANNKSILKELLSSP